MLSPAATAALLGVSQSSLAKWRCAGTGPAFLKLGRRVAYSTADIDAWLADRRRTSTWAPANDNEPGPSVYKTRGFIEL